jgi:hypothetical protein
VAVGVSSYEAVNLYKGRRVIASKGEGGTNLGVHQLVLYCACGIVAGVVGGLLGLGDGFILGPLFLELGIPLKCIASPKTIITHVIQYSLFTFPLMVQSINGVKETLIYLLLKNLKILPCFSLVNPHSSKFIVAFSYWC